MKYVCASLFSESFYETSNQSLDKSHAVREAKLHELST